MPLTQTQLASEVADRSGLTKSDAKAALAALASLLLRPLRSATSLASCVWVRAIGLLRLWAR